MDRSEDGQFGWPWLSPIRKDRLMGQVIIIRRSANLIEISNDGTSPLDQTSRDLLEPRLTYTHQKYLRGPDRIDPISGYTKGPFAFEEKRLFKYDGKGRFVCGIGFFKKIVDLLSKSGASISTVNTDPTHPRIRRFEEDWDNVAQTVNFRPKQADCLVNISANEYGTIKAPTGFGKGMIIAMVCLLYPYAKIHVVTPSKDLVAKTVALLTKFLPNIGQVGCGKKRIERITVFSADSLHLSDGDADIMLADEIHQLAAPTYSDSLAKYKYSRNFGFSATPTGRQDGADAKLESLFGSMIFELSYQEAVNLGLVVDITVDWLDVRMSMNPCEGKKDTSKKRWGIWRNETRNKIIADKALSYDTNDQVLILVETIEHLLFLRKLLPGFESCYSENGLKSSDIDLYKRWGLMEPMEEPIKVKEREQLRKNFETGLIKKVIATSVWATGVDFEQLAVLIRADAMGSEIMDIQAPGRVSRRNTKGEKEVGIVVDCRDQFDDGLRRKALGRQKSYESNGWTQLISTTKIRNFPHANARL